MSQRYQAPFRSGGPSEIDRNIATQLLGIALERGGDHADLYFEYSVSGSYAFDEGILKSAGRAVSLGLGVRVVVGDSTGYAYVQDLTMEAMERAARTAGQIAHAGGQRAPEALGTSHLSARYPVPELSLDIAGAVKKELL